MKYALHWVNAYFLLHHAYSALQNGWCEIMGARTKLSPTIPARVRHIKYLVDQTFQHIDMLMFYMMGA
jgi:hypothetical protein